MYNLKANKSLFFSKLKYGINNFDSSNIIYRIDCYDREKIYIGQTMNTKSLHKIDVRSHPEICALIFHLNNLNHSFNFTNAKVPDRAQNKKRDCSLKCLSLCSTKDLMLSILATSTNYYSF